MKIKYIIFSVFIAVVLIFGAYRANASAFVINLYYDSTLKTLRFDNKAEKTVVLDSSQDVSIVEFAKNIQSGEYKLILYDEKGNDIADTEFNAKSGSFKITLPYFSIANELKIFEKKSNKKLLDADLSQFVTCNGNGTCEFEKGENNDTCIGDCASSNIKFSPETKALLDKNNGVIKDQKTGAILLQGNIAEKQETNISTQNSNNKMWSIILIVAMLSIVAGIIYFIVRKKIIQR